MKKINNYIAKNINEYNDLYSKSISHPENFWSDIASTFDWRKKWTKTLEYDFNKPEFKWFLNGKLNITENCLDRHLKHNPNKTAILFEPNDPKEATQKISYKELHRRVCVFANVLKNKNVKKGDRVCIYMPMVPELTIAVLACARVGAVHSVVFAGFSATALAARINDSECKVLLTADGSFRGSKVIDLKTIVDQALIKCNSINSTIVLKRIGSDIQMNSNQSWWHDEIKNISTDCFAEEMDSEDMLFILYTSGSTGKPKGMVHSCGGYMIYSAYTFLNVFQYKPNDIYWCTADIGWITGHSYIVYGPLLSGATSVMFEGVPSYPDYSRFWNIVEKHKITHFYTAPTAIRALAKHSVSLVESNDLSSLKVLGTVGEPINEEAWHWYDKNIGKVTGRLKNGWTPEEAVDLEEHKREHNVDKDFTCEGKSYPNARALADAYDKTHRYVSYRMSLGATPEQAVGLESFTPDTETSRAIEFRGTNYPSLLALAEAFNVKYTLFISRRHRGWSLEDSLELTDKARSRTSSSDTTNISIDGNTFKDSNAFAKFYDLDPLVVEKRMNSGWSPQRILDDQ